MNTSRIAVALAFAACLTGLGLLAGATFGEALCFGAVPGLVLGWFWRHTFEGAWTWLWP